MTGEVLGWIIVGVWMFFLTFRCISLERQRDGWKKRADFWHRAYHTSEKLREEGR